MITLSHSFLPSLLSNKCLYSTSNRVHRIKHPAPINTYLQEATTSSTNSPANNPEGQTENITPTGRRLKGMCVRRTLLESRLWKITVSQEQTSTRRRISRQVIRLISQHAHHAPHTTHPTSTQPTCTFCQVARPLRGRSVKGSASELRNLDLVFRNCYLEWMPYLPLDRDQD
ncbi:hypothetical protein E2C01_091917 [Portunus trituberculatus]|uniref:Uncharacterized protein n=1 Tax=Portunus trituberculatus TaxID=210409 RepID=A0A5B7JU57_PORTR|nr:hypothetical protein [Portunus trituberculatus]